MTGEYKTNSGNQGTTDTAMSKNSAVLMSKITWTSSDESVAEVIDGVVGCEGSWQDDRNRNGSGRKHGSIYRNSFRKETFPVLL